MRGVVSAIDRGVRDTLADLDAAIDSVARREPLINREVEKARLIATLADEMGHPEIADVGLGAVDPARFAKAIDIVVKANGLPRTPAVSEIFDDSFLPPLEARLKSLV